MPFETLAKAPEPKEIVEKLVHWVNEGGRCPAIFAADPMASDRKMRQLLADYVDTWLAAGCQLRHWKLRREFEKIVKPVVLSQPENQPVKTKTRWSFRSRDDVADFEDVFSGESWDTLPPQTDLVTEEEEEKLDDERHALEDEISRQVTREKAAQIFLMVITSRYYRNLGRCIRCGKLYFNTSNQAQKQYCTQRCASFDSSARSSQKQRDERREEKLAMLRASEARLSKLNATKRAEIHDVQGWLAQDSDLTRHFVTRHQSKKLPVTSKLKRKEHKE